MGRTCSTHKIRTGDLEVLRLYEYNIKVDLKETGSGLYLCSLGQSPITRFCEYNLGFHEVRVIS